MTTVGGVGMAGGAVLILAYLILRRADPYHGYGGVGRGGIVLAALCGGALPIFTTFAETGWSLFGALAGIAQGIAAAADTVGGT